MHRTRTETPFVGKTWVTETTLPRLGVLSRAITASALKQTPPVKAVADQKNCAACARLRPTAWAAPSTAAARVVDAASALRRLSVSSRCPSRLPFMRATPTTVLFLARSLSRRGAERRGEAPAPQMVLCNAAIPPSSASSSSRPNLYASATREREQRSRPTSYGVIILIIIIDAVRLEWRMATGGCGCGEADGCSHAR